MLVQSPWMNYSSKAFGYRTISAHTVGKYRPLYNWWMISAKLFEMQKKRCAVLGEIILHDDGEYLNVVDGQQRLLTLRMILAAFNPINHQISVSGNSKTPVSLVWIELQRRLSQLEDKKVFLDFICHKCQLVRIVTDDIDEAFRVFDSRTIAANRLPLMTCSKHTTCAKCTMSPLL